jgi:hypothetical protein
LIWDNEGTRSWRPTSHATPAFTAAVRAIERRYRNELRHSCHREEPKINARDKRARETTHLTDQRGSCAFQRERIQIRYDRSAQTATAIIVTSKVSIIGASQSGDLKATIFTCVVFQCHVVASSK